MGDGHTKARLGEGPCQRVGPREALVDGGSSGGRKGGCPASVASSKGSGSSVGKSSTIACTREPPGGGSLIG